MKIKIIVFIIVLLMTLSIFAVSADVKQSTTSKSTSTDLPPYKDPSLPIELRVEDLLNRMTLEEKIEQMSIYEDFSEALISFIIPIISPGNTNKRLGIPSLRGTGSSHGILYGTAFPVSICRGASWDPLLEYRVNEAIGKEAEAIGANLVFAPMVNIVRHPGWGRSQESYSEDTYHMSKLCVASIGGLQNHVMSQVKAFALNSIEENRFRINVNVDERTLHEVYLPHFKAAVQEANVSSVMSSYNKVNGLYMSENEYLLKDILKENWGFDGFVSSDAWANTSTIGSALAGLDIEMPTPISYGEKLLNAVIQGDVSESVINESVSRILRKKFSFGLFEKEPKYQFGVLRNKDHKELSLEAALNGIVLLKNENNALPIKQDEVKRVAVIGRYADKLRLGDLGSSWILPIKAVTPLTGIKNEAKNVRIISYTGQSTNFAKLYAKAADVAVVVVALTAADEGEWIANPKFPFGGDREDLGLAKCDVEMINAVAKVNDRVIVVMEAGSAITMNDWINNVEGIVMAWYPGTEGGNAIADILFGDFNPCGKLPLTFPKSMEQLYVFGSNQDEVDYGYYHGYRYFDKYDMEPLFPFGFGLSYTTFNYSNLSLSTHSIGVNETLKITFNLENTGDIAGSEIVQLYIGYKNSCVDRAVKDLKGFTKIFLEPRQKKTVCLNLSTKDLAYYDVNSDEFVIEPIIYSVHVGSSSRSLPLKAEFYIEDR